MRHAWSLLVLSSLLTIPAAAQNSPPEKPLTSLEQTLISSENNLIAAKKKDDATFFQQTLAENFSLVGIDGKLIEAPGAAGELGDSDLVELAPYNMKVVTHGDNLAIVTYDAIVRTAPQEDQGPPPRYQHFSSVWIKQAGEWKLQFHQTTAAHYGDW